MLISNSTLKMKKITVILYLVISIISAIELKRKPVISNNVNDFTEREDHTVTTRNVYEKKSTLNLDELLNESKPLPDQSNYSSKDSLVTIRYYKTPKRSKENPKDDNDFTLKLIKVRTTPPYEIKNIETNQNNRGEFEVIPNKHDENVVSKSGANVNEIPKLESTQKSFEREAADDIKSSVDNILNEFQDIGRSYVPIEKLDDENTKIHSIVEDSEKEVRADSHIRMSLEDLKRELKIDYSNEPLEKLRTATKFQREKHLEEEDPSVSKGKSSFDDVTNEIENSRRNEDFSEKLEKKSNNEIVNEWLKQRLTVDPRTSNSVKNVDSGDNIESTRKDNDSVNKSHKITEDENIENEAESSFRSSNDDNEHEHDVRPIDDDNDPSKYFMGNEYPYLKLKEKLNKSLRETDDLSVVTTDLYDVSNVQKKLAKPEAKTIEPVAISKSGLVPEYTPVTNVKNDKDNMDLTRKGLSRSQQLNIHQHHGLFNVQPNPVTLNPLLGPKTNNLGPYGLPSNKMENIHPQENYQETITQLKSSKVTDDFSLRMPLPLPYMPLTLGGTLQGSIGLNNIQPPRLIQPFINLRNVVNLNKQNMFKTKFSTFKPNILLPSFG